MNTEQHYLPDNTVNGYALTGKRTVEVGPGGSWIKIVARWASQPSTWLCLCWYSWRKSGRWSVTAHKRKRDALTE